MSFGLYLHIPYCLAKCSYCNFHSAGGNSSVPDIYVNALLREIHKHKAYSPKTVYFGGGTPSLLSPAQVNALLSAINPQAGAEITLEVNPETASLEKLTGYKESGVTRLSVGVQSAYSSQLKTLGRLHTAETAANAFSLAMQAGFENISGDIMLALPYYSNTELDDTLALIKNGGATHISCYLLKIEEGTPFFGANLQLPTEDETADFYLYAVKRLEENGYKQYEISNFAKPGFESKHNLIYWNCENYLGIGPAAHSCMNNKRFCYTEDTHAFITSSENITVQDGAFSVEDYIMLQLRLNTGLCLPVLEENYGYAFPEKVFEKLQIFEKKGLCVLEENRVSLTTNGMLLQNHILAEIT